LFHYTADNVDVLMRRVFTRLLSGHKQNNRVAASKGQNTEVFGALLELTDPLARLGRSRARARVFSPLGELMWYLSGSDELDPIAYYLEGYHRYSDDLKTLNGAYGKRIFGAGRAAGEAVRDEWQRVIDTLRESPDSRNAVIQIYANADGAKRPPANERSKDIPCTCTLHFVIRKNKLYLHVHMRSNDAYWGLPHDIFSFTMLQEIAARELGVGLGSYQHSVASLHLYDDGEKTKPRTEAQNYLNEGLFDAVPMPQMPEGDPWPAIRQVLTAEAEIRACNVDYKPLAELDPYWLDLVTLLRAWALIKTKGGIGVDALLAELRHPGYRLYILDHLAKKAKANPPVIKDLYEPELNDAPGNS
jgi:thymidylate synthase